MKDLISLGELQRMQDSFSEVANVSIRTVDPAGIQVGTYSNVTTDDFSGLDDSTSARITLFIKENIRGDF